MNLSSMFSEVQYRAAMLAPMSITLVDSELRRRLANTRRATTRHVDETLEDSFPASDPPSWTYGVASTTPINGVVSDIGMWPQLLRRVAAAL